MFCIFTEVMAQDNAVPLLIFSFYLCLTVILLPAHSASFVHKFLFQRVLASPRVQKYCRLVIKNSVLDS